MQCIEVKFLIVAAYMKFVLSLSELDRLSFKYIRFSLLLYCEHSFLLIVTKEERTDLKKLLTDKMDSAGSKLKIAIELVICNLLFFTLIFASLLGTLARAGFHWSLLPKSRVFDSLLSAVEYGVENY